MLKSFLVMIMIKRVMAIILIFFNFGKTRWHLTHIMRLFAGAGILHQGNSPPCGELLRYSTLTCRESALAYVCVCVCVRVHLCAYVRLQACTCTHVFVELSFRFKWESGAVPSSRADTPHLMQLFIVHSLMATLLAAFLILLEPLLIRIRKLYWNILT